MALPGKRACFFRAKRFFRGGGNDALVDHDCSGLS